MVAAWHRATDSGDCPDFLIRARQPSIETCFHVGRFLQCLPYSSELSLSLQV